MTNQDAVSKLREALIIAVTKLPRWADQDRVRVKDVARAITETLAITPAATPDCAYGAQKLYRKDACCSSWPDCLLEPIAATPQDVESLAAAFHAVYQAEAKRQGDVRHHDNYQDLSENIKEFDRALARYVLQNFERRELGDYDYEGQP